MNTFTMAGADHAVLLHHLAFYGLADILGDREGPEVRMSWNAGQPTIHGDGLTADVVDDAVRRHVEDRRIWIDRTVGTSRVGLMSPRLTAPTEPTGWTSLQLDREEVLDQLAERRRWTDLRYLAALGEPCYWRLDPKSKPLLDDGASRLEMQPRNRGSEFVGNRLRPLTEKLLAWERGRIAAGLDGSRGLYEPDGNPNSRIATGLANPGPFDSSIVWCALWGIGQFPTALRTRAAAATSGHLREGRRDWFYVPVWEGLWRPARLRSILAARQLRDAASGDLERGTEDLATRAGRTWLRTRGVVGVLRFPIGQFGTDKAAERRALRAEPVPLSTPR